jgi:uncharacterized protein
LVANIDTTATKLTAQQKEDLEGMNGLKERSTREAKLKAAEKEIRAINGSYASLYEYQGDKSVHVELYYTYFYIWDVLLFMFLGMAFFKNGILLGTAPAKIYWILFIGGLVLGLLFSYYRQQAVITNSFSYFNFSKNVSLDYYQLARVLRSLGYFGLVMLLYKSGLFKWFFVLFRPVGQMAFSNYLAQSLMGGLFFYGIGLGYFGKLERHELYYFVGAAWLIEITWSHLWLRYFRFGPLEWAWRSLTYWKKQPLRK